MSMDSGAGHDRLSVSVLAHPSDKGRCRTNLRVDKWDLDQAHWTRKRLGLLHEPVARDFFVAGVTPFEVFEAEDVNLVCDAGWQLMMNGIAGSAVTKYSATVGRIGTSAGGSSPTTVTPAYTDTNLAYTTTNYWQLISAAPTVGSTHTAGLIFAATFATGNANWQWMEAATDQGTSSGANASATATMLNHMGWSTGSYTGPGTKTSSQVWNVTETITWS